MSDRGRPRRFDRDTALKVAMEVFWRLGYESASLSELTRAMGINSPSLYACFGSKEELFRAAVERYIETIGRETQNALEQPPTAKEGIEAMLRHNVHSYTRPDRPSGCLVVLGDRNTLTEHDAIRRYLAQRRSESEAMVERRLQRGIAEGDLPAGIDTKSIAAFYATVVHGLTLQSRDGASEGAMNRIVDCAMAAWDSLSSAGTSKPI
jgi:AcrR family transcriptional regulator